MPQPTDDGSSHVDPRLDEIIDGLYRVSIKAVIVRDSQLLLTYEQDDWYSVPGGGMKHGSNVEETIKRELEEEVGVPPEYVTVDPKIFTFSFGRVMRGVPRANLYFRVQLADRAKLTGGELDYRWVGKDELDHLQLSPATAKLTELLKSLL